MPVVGSVAVLIVEVVHVPAVLHGPVAAALAMLVRVVGMLAVRRVGALIPVPIVGDVRVAVVMVVEVPGVADRGVATGLAVLVVMAGVDRVVDDGHRSS
jgi:hypothetical protein